MKRRHLFALLLFGLAACVPKQYYVLSPDNEYSDDESVSVRLLAVDEVEKDTQVVLEIENRRDEPIDLGATSIEVYDFSDASYPPTPTPEGEIAPGETKTLQLTFGTGEAKGDNFELRLEGFPVKVWPIVYSKEKPPDFKETPEPQQGQRPPNRPPGPTGPY